MERALIANSGTLYYAGKPVLGAVKDLLKPREAITIPKPVVKAVPVLVVRDEREIRLQRLYRIMDRTRKQRIKKKLSVRINRMESFTG